MKELKDYLHFYLGCECMLDGRLKMILCGFQQNGHNIYKPVVRRVDYVWKTVMVNEVELLKPILRPLSDMIEEELIWWFNSLKKEKDEFYKAEWQTELNNQPCDPHWVLWTTDTKYGRLGYTIGINNHFTSEQFRWLLSKHFDVFGLIESGLAIDKNKINNHD